MNFARRRIATETLEFELLEVGSGPLALCLHGFPDTAYTWRDLLPRLADAGFHAVAPFMRGYAPTAIPSDGRYGREDLVADAGALHDALGGDSDAVLIGHDWGAAATYDAGAVGPERWRRLVTLAIPPPPLDVVAFGDYAQMKRFFYMFVFQTAIGEELAAASEMAFLEWLWRDWSPGYDPTKDFAWIRESLAARENLSAALGYYRALFEALESGGLSVPGTGPQPTLYLHGTLDGCFWIELLRDGEQHLPPGSRMAVVEGAGHFLHLERPEEVGELIVKFVTS